MTMFIYLVARMGYKATFYISELGRGVNIPELVNAAQKLLKAEETWRLDTPKRLATIETPSCTLYYMIKVVYKNKRTGL